MPSTVITIVTVYVPGHKYILGPSQSSRLTARAKMSRAQNIFMPTTIVLLELTA